MNGFFARMPVSMPSAASPITALAPQVMTVVKNLAGHGIEQHAIDSEVAAREIGDEPRQALGIEPAMNRIAMRERFLVLYPEQDRLANGQGCWNWFDTRTGRAYGESALIMKAIDQVCLLYAADRTRIAIAFGISRFWT